jgi:hypothetical protein
MIIKLAIGVILQYSEVLIYGMLAVGAFGLTLTVGLTLLLVFRLFIGVEVPVGYPTVILLLLGNLVLTVAGLAIQMLFAKRIMDEVVARPRGIVQAECGLPKNDFVREVTM